MNVKKIKNFSMNVNRIWVAAAGMLVLAALPVAAHHSFATVFDQNRPAQFTGAVTKVEWTNPHVWFYVDVKDANGTVKNYACESGPPNILVRNGWKRDSLKIGDVVSVTAFQAKDSTDTYSTKEIRLADGKRIFAGNADDAPKE
jgi:hypothetical protein